MQTTDRAQRTRSRRLAHYAAMAGALIGADRAAAGPIDTVFDPAVVIGDGASQQLLIDADQDGTDDLRLFWSSAFLYPDRWKGFFIQPMRFGVSVLANTSLTLPPFAPTPFGSAPLAVYYGSSRTLPTASQQAAYVIAAAALWAHKSTSTLDGGNRGGSVRTYGYFVATDVPQFAAFRLVDAGGATALGFVQLRHLASNPLQIEVEAVRVQFGVGSLHVEPIVPNSGFPPPSGPAVPEPGTLALLATGAAGLGRLRRRRRER